MSDQTKKIEPTVRTQEEWTRWEPVEGVAGIYDILSCCEDYRTGFIVVLCDPKDQKKQLYVTWKYSVKAYKIAETQLAVKTVNDSKGYDAKVYHDKTFFKITHSKYYQELVELSGGLLDYGQVPMHFVIVSSKKIIDVITGYEPEVAFVHIS